ncbi:hypothetical protein TRFO_30785 [Tritrichomonas foetus]|uniref:DUF3730 domain-containing protein n=1 Tax=Tritrichomonas foetus TaxID=1144522 RepID=A0A1J4JXF5_9EUKA|nr:hypothetical protein TRFO_30785 [Tritrichomonas foetus]|eukprot:OHT02214.1 hypothetical protein TRFO_30785 [Tritrichomonas foetus]
MLFLFFYFIIFHLYPKKKPIEITKISRMNEVKERLSNLIKENTIKDANVVIGKELQSILSMLQKDQFSGIDIEDLLFSLIAANNHHLSSVVANLIGCCLVSIYKTRKISHWKFVSIIQDGISKSSIPAIIVLGIVARHSTEGFKSQLPSLISSILQIHNNSIQPYICQCFRRILKGTGTFLTKSVSDIFLYVSKHINSPNDSLKLECIKTLPVLYISSKIPLEKVLPFFNIAINSQIYTLRYATAKSLATLGFSGCESNIGQTKGDQDPFSFFFQLIFDLFPRDPSVSTISSSFIIFLRFFEPLFIIENVKYLVKFVIEFTTLKYLSLPSLSILTFSMFNAICHTTGESISSSICNSVFEQLKDKPLTGSTATVALTTFIHFNATSKTISRFTKFAYPLLSTTRSDVRRLCSAYFAVLAQKEPQISILYYKTFIDFFKNTSSANEHEVDGFSRATVYNIMYNHHKINENEIRDLALAMLKNSKFSSYSYLILAAIQNKWPTSEETLSQIFSLILTEITKNNSYKQPKFMKFVSIFILQVIISNKGKIEKYQNVIVAYLQSYLQNYSNYSTPTHLAFFKIAKECQFAWKQIPNLASTISKISLILSNKYITSETIEIIHPFAGKIDQVYDLYGIRIPQVSNTLLDSESQTIYKLLIDDYSYSNRLSLLKEIENSFSIWVIISDNNNKKSIITSLFSPSKDNNYSKILLIRSILSRTKLSPFLPSNGLPFLLGFESINDRTIQRHASMCAAKWLKVHPELVEACLNYLEMPTRNPNFACFALGELSRSISDPNRSISILYKIIETQQIQSPLYALSAFLKNCQISEDHRQKINNLLEKSAFAESMRNPSTILFYKSCFIHLKSANPVAVFSLLNFPVFRSYTTLQGYEMMKIMPLESSLVIKPVFSSDHTPPMLIAQTFKYSESIEDVPQMLTLLQQTHLTSVSESLLKAVDTYTDMKYWTEMCKRVVINKCVPPAERKGDTRVNPTRVVLIVAMRVVVKLVNKMRELFPLQLNCIDDVVSIAFNAIQINDRKIDFHSFAILAAVLRAFIDVKNRDGALLNTYLSQFHPMLRHALDGSRALKSVADFCISYINFLAESQNTLLDEAIKIIEKRLAKIEISGSIESLIVFCRITSRVTSLIIESQIKQTTESSKESNSNENNLECFDKRFKESSLMLIDMICKNKVRLSDLDDELPDFISASLPFFSEELKKVVLLIILNDLSKPNCQLSVLTALTIILEHVKVSNEMLDFMIHTVAQKKDIFNILSESENNENKQLFDDEDSLDVDFYWIAKKSRKSGYHYFLTKVSELISGNQNNSSKEMWKAVYSLSIEKPICFPAVSILLKNSQDDSIVISSLPLIIETNNSLPFCVQLFERLKPSQADQIIKFIANSNAKNKFELIKAGLAKFGEYQLTCIDDICHLLQGNEENPLIPNGINFVASLLVEKQTVNFGLNILNHGIADSIVVSLPHSLRSLPRILHFFNLALSKLNEKVKATNSPINIDNFERSLVSVVFLSLKLTANQKERAAVVSPATMILKNIKQSILHEKWEKETRKSDIFTALDPPKSKKAAVIELKTFGVLKQPTTSKWQTLEIED